MWSSEVDAVEIWTRILSSASAVKMRQQSLAPADSALNQQLMVSKERFSIFSDGSHCTFIHSHLRGTRSCTPD